MRGGPQTAEAAEARLHRLEVCRTPTTTAATIDTATRSLASGDIEATTSSVASVAGWPVVPEGAAVVTLAAGAVEVGAVAIMTGLLTLR